MSKQILIVDDEPNVRLSYRMTLETEGFVVREADSAARALRQFDEEHFDMAILDMRMPETDGLDLLEEMRKRKIMTPAVIITAYGDVPHAVRAMQLGAIDFLQKPLTPEALRSLVTEILARHVETKTTANRETVPDTFAEQLSETKRLLNLQVFEPAWRHLSRALELNPNSPDALNLAGVYFEMNRDYDRARKLYGKAIKYGPYYEPAQQNMRRIFELFHFGSSEEPMAFGDDV
ncbi:MAG TPA: response regulator [Chthoniobacter sp.]|jgi:FixJ family two-component response regulator